MKNLKLFFLSLLLVVVSACNDKAEILPNGKEGLNPDLVENGSRKGVMRIKLSEEVSKTFNVTVTRNGISTGVTRLDAAMQSMGVKEIKRTFSHGGKYEERRRKAGLHLWYDIIFDEDYTNTRAYNSLLDIEGLEIVEPIFKIERVDGASKPVVLTQDLLESISAQQENTLRKYNTYFNDEHLEFQWHYNNEGQYIGYVAGADVNLFAGWEMETGKPEVVISIVDGGIQVDHPDLAANIWINVAEMNGEEGVDDDGNGYADDIHGFNFVTYTGTISSHDHGTHVAGTVAAVNNNGIGVSGVAGGDGTPGSGVRMMSCQIFDNEFGSGNAADAIVYGADNGAVISQNSWGYAWDGADQDLLEADKAAIDYFIQYAGTDVTGEYQVGPMKGGIVIFATGNANISGLSMPPAYEKVLSVASISPGLEKAPYSNYGTWVDVSAPGGDSEFGLAGNVLSTIPGNGYGYMEGTSMACPHVSGIAGLVVSKFGGDGFTNKNLWNRLLNGTNDISRFVPEYGMGVGYVNAQKALASVGEIAPDRVYDFDGEPTFERVNFSWSITADADNGKPERYEIVWSQEPLWRMDLNNLPEDARKRLVRVPESGSVGDRMSADADGLVSGISYYFAIVGVDRDGNVSPSTTLYGEIPENQAPVVEGIPSDITLKKAEKRTVVLNIYDPDGYNWTYSLNAGSGALKATRNGNNLILNFDADKAAPGNYRAKLMVQDEQEVSDVVEIAYTVLPNSVPAVVKEIGQVLFYDKGVTQKFNLSEYIVDVDGDELTYTIESSNPSVASMSVHNNVLEIVSLDYGSADITLTAFDPLNDKVRAYFNILSRNPEQKVDLYPVPVKKDGLLNIRMGEEVEGTITVTLHNMAGAKVFSEKASIAPGSPASVDLSSLPGGNYRVSVRYINQEYTQNITKL